MAIITYPLNNVDYSAEGAEIFHCTRTSGVFAGDLDYPVTCSGADNNVTVGQGMAWIRNARFAGKAVAHKESTVLNAGLADPTYPRIDAVVLQFSAAQNATNLIIKKGRAQTGPQPPEVVRTESVYELHLCHIYRKAGAVSVTPENLTDLRENEKFCGIMYDDVTLRDTLQFLTKADKGVAGGVAELGEDGKVLKNQLPSMDYIPKKDRGAYNGVASLVNGKVPAGQLPSMNYVPTSQKGTANGVASLDSKGKVLGTQMPFTAIKLKNSDIVGVANFSECVDSGLYFYTDGQIGILTGWWKYKSNISGTNLSTEIKNTGYRSIGPEVSASLAVISKRGNGHTWPDSKLVSCGSQPDNYNLQVDLTAPFDLTPGATGFVTATVILPVAKN